MSKKLYFVILFVVSLVLLNSNIIFASSKPKLESKGSSIYIGSSKTVTLIGSNIKSVICISKDTGIAKVKAIKTKAIKVTGVSEGKTKIVVTVVTKAKKSFKLKYTVTVKAKEEVVKESDVESSTDNESSKSDSLVYTEELYVYDLDKLIETLDNAETIGEKYDKPVTVIFKSEDGGYLEIPANDYSYVIFRFKAPDVDIVNNAHFREVHIEDFED